MESIARNASHFTAKRVSSAFVTIERLSTKKIDATRWSAAAMIVHRQAPRINSKISEVEFLLVDFSLYFCWLLHRVDLLHLPIISRFTFLFIVLCVCEWQGCSRTWRSFCRSAISIQRAFKLKKLEWPCGWEYKQAFSCLVASSGRLQKMFQKFIEHQSFQSCIFKGRRLFPTFSVQTTANLWAQISRLSWINAFTFFENSTKKFEL